MIREFTHALPDGTYENGAFSLLEWNCTKPKVPLVMIDRYHDQVIMEYERNMHDDSDFYAVIWDEETQKPRHIMYATTRGYSYPCSCVVDATPAILTKYSMWIDKITKVQTHYEEQKKKFIPTKGRLVRSLTKRGRAKGKQGIINWVGSSFYGTYSIQFQADNSYVFVNIEQTELFDDETETWVPCASRSDHFGWVVPDHLLPVPNNS